MDENQSAEVSPADIRENGVEISDIGLKVDSPSTSEQEVNKQLGSENETTTTADVQIDTDNNTTKDDSNENSTKAEKRNVYFPVDGNIVKSYLEPPDPWKNGKHLMHLVLQRKPFTFELFFCLANAGFFTFSSKTHSIVPTSNLCQNVKRPKNQLNQ